MIHSINIRNFRCFKSLSIEDCKRFNIIVGDNGAGKTALLEAIFLALASSPLVAVRFRQFRGIAGEFGGALHIVEEALWRDFFYRGDWDSPFSIELRGDGEESRSLIVAKGSASEMLIPLTDAAGASAGVSGVEFRWRNAAGIERVYQPKVSASGISISEQEETLPNFFHFAANQTTGSRENAERFSQLRRAGRIQTFVEAIKENYSWIRNLDIEVVAGSSIIYVTMDTGDQYPLNNVSGGINRIISILLATASGTQAVVSVDEVEDGIYFKHQPDIWRVLASVARRYQTQLFITTHNEERLEAIFEDENVSDVALWRLERTANGPRLRQFSGKQAAIAVRSEGEIR